MHPMPYENAPCKAVGRNHNYDDIIVHNICDEKQREALRYGSRTPPSRGYIYREGATLSAVCRFEAGILGPSKTFRQALYHESLGTWAYSLRKKDGKYDLPIYCSDTLKKFATHTIVIVEGEEDVLRLYSMGIVDRGYLATTLPGGADISASKVKDKHLKVLANRNIVLCGDTDDVGVSYMQALGRKLSNVAKSVSIVDLPTWEGMPANADISDYIDRGHDLDDVLKLFENADLSNPKPLTSVSDSNDCEDLDIQERPVLHQSALYGLAGDFVELAIKHCEAGKEAILLSFLSMTGCFYGASSISPRVEIGASQHYPCLFTCIAGASGVSRKGTSFAPVGRLLELMTGRPRNSIDKNAIKLGEESDSLAIKTNPGHIHFHAGGLSSGEGIVHRIRDDRPHLQPNPDPGEPDKRLLVLQTEFGGVIRVMCREGNTLKDIVRNSWDRMPLDPLTKRDQIGVKRPHMCIIGHVTPEELKELLASSDIFNGFANRFLWVQTERRCIEPFLPPLDDNALRPFADSIRQAVKKSLGRIVTFNEPARTLWVKLYNELSQREAHGVFGAVTGRAEAQLLRIGLVFALNDTSEHITVEHLSAAHSVWKYCEDSVAYLFGRSSMPQRDKRILGYLKNAGGRMTLTEMHAAFGNKLSKKELETPIDRLVKRGKVRLEKEATPGRPRQVLVLDS